MSHIPTLTDIFKAQQLLRQYLLPTLLHHYPALSQLLEAEVYVKHENHTPIGSFKIRGGINALAQLDEDVKKRGVIVASSGNFGQAMAFAGQMFGVKAVVVLPENPNPGKAEAIKSFGGELVLYGRDYDESREHILAIAAEKGYYYLNDAEEPAFVAGLGTLGLEILEQLPDTEIVIAPVGGGGLISSLCIAGKGIKPDLAIIGVCSEKAPSPYLSWKEGRLVEAPMETDAEGIAVRSSFAAPQKIMREMLDDFVLVSEDEIKRAIVLMLEKTHNLAEGAGAAPLAATLKMKDQIRNKKTVLILSGGNISLDQLRDSLSKGIAATGKQD
ncbi:MAG: threonine/serine dehydratase [Dehalococcoidia bacterium]